MTSVRGLPLIAILALTGCYIDIGDGYGDDGYYDDGYYYEGETTVPASASLHRGDMGSVHGFDGHIIDVTASNYGGYGSVTVISENRADGWAAMSILNINGGLDHPDLVPGRRFTFSSSDYGYDDGSGTSPLHVSLIGCSGPQNGSWDFDQGADSVEVEVVDTGTVGTVEVRYAASFNAYDYETGATTPQTVEGSFRYRR